MEDEKGKKFLELCEKVGEFPTGILAVPGLYLEAYVIVGMSYHNEYIDTSGIWIEEDHWLAMMYFSEDQATRMCELLNKEALEYEEWIQSEKTTHPHELWPLITERAIAKRGEMKDKKYRWGEKVEYYVDSVQEGSE